MQNAEGRVQNGLTLEKAIAMIADYLQEPINISKEWVAVLELCKKDLEENEARKISNQSKIETICDLQAEVERLKKSLDNMTDALVKTDESCRKAKSEAIKEFWSKLKATIQADKSMLIVNTSYTKGCNDAAGWCISTGDNLAKEMTEGKE